MRSHPKKTSIIATLGPASYAPSVIERLIRAGTDLFRLNFSHGSHSEYDRAIMAIRKVSRKLDMHVGILCDLQGPKIRTRRTEGDKAVGLKKGTMVEITSKSLLCDSKRISIDLPHLYRHVNPGQNILINDGAIRLRVIEVDNTSRLIRCKVLNSGYYTSNKGINLPGTKVRISSLTKKDKEDLAFALQRDVEFVALSFVRHERDLKLLSRLINAAGKNIKCIAKLEKPEAVARLSKILDFCDGIMVARGDLGVETSPARMPILQKDSVQDANRLGKFTIVATQMLESMINQAFPTRAETTDVANAILDGADGVMLSGETSVGKYPVESVKAMAEIARETERSAYYPRPFRDLSLKKNYPPHAICEAANWASRDLEGAPVIVFTMTGANAHYLSKIRFQAPIFAFTPNDHVARSLSLAWNIVPFVLEYEENMRILQKRAEDLLMKSRRVKKGELVIILGGEMLVKGATTQLEIKKVGEE
ncbi:pyruvate kinase [Fibrobacterota bacterium]